MRLQSVTDIAAPPEDVWALISDVRSWPTLLPDTVSSVTPLAPDRPDEVGARYVMEQPRLPKATWEMSGWDPPHQFSWFSRQPGVTTTGTHIVEGRSTGATRATLAIDWTGPLAWPVRLLYGRLTQRYVDVEGRRLKERAESA